MTAAHSLFQSNANAQAIQYNLEYMPMTIMLFDLGSMTATCSRALRKLFELPEKASVELLTQLVHEDDKDRVTEVGTKVLQTGYETLQYRSSTCSGNLMWVHSENYVIYDQQGAPTHVVNHIFDISTIKHNEELLSNNLNLHYLMMNKCQEAIWRVELTEPMDITLPQPEQVEQLLHNAYFAEHNPAYADNLNMPGVDLTGRSLSSISPDADSAREQLADFIQHRYEYPGLELERDNWGPSRAIKHLRMWTTPVIENGKLLGFWGMLSDLTERKKHEEVIFQISQGLSSKTGNEFFDALTKYIVETLGADSAFLVEFNDSNNQSRVCNGYDVERGHYESFDMSSSVSDISYIEKKCRSTNIAIADAQDSSPASKQMIAALNISNYAVCLLKDNHGNVQGYLSILFKNAINDTDTLRNLLQIFSLRAAAELQRRQNEEALKKSKEELEYLANHDALTGLANRHSFIHTLDTMLEQQTTAQVGLMLLDLDGFKEVNDTLGHQMGDTLLIMLSKRLKNIERQNTDCIMARLGGDEFAFAIKNTNIAKLEAFAQTLMSELHATIELENIQLQLNGSLGIAVYPDMATTTSKLMSCADVAMYHAKNNGRQVQLYDASIDTHSRKRLALMSDLKTAIGNNEMALVYQPLIDIKNNRLRGFEALIRWHHPDFGLVMPMEFIPLAELGEVIHDITEWVVKTAARQIKTWKNEGHDYVVSLNLSAKNMMDTELIHRVGDIIQQSGLSSSNFELEITESALMVDIDRATRVITDFKALGVNSVIDDYGTGYSSLAYLQRLPIEKLKIDRAFVSDMVTNPQDKIIVQSTIQLAHNLGKKVVAEGIEDQATLDALKELGCDIAQGYFFGKPMPAEYWDDYPSQHAATG